MSCCDGCKKMGGSCGGGLANPPGRVEQRFGLVTGAEDMQVVLAQVAEGTKGNRLRGVGDPITIPPINGTVSTGTATTTTPVWEFVALGLGGLAVGVFGAMMYRKRNPIHVGLPPKKRRRLRRARRSAPNLYRRR